MTDLAVYPDHLERLQEAADMVTLLRVRRAAIDPAEETEILSAPGCDQGCSLCPRTCAVTGIILRWWEGELASLTGGASGRLH